MSERVVIDCNWCEAKEAKGARRIGVLVDRDTVSGVGNIVLPLDLCPTCLAKALQEFIGRLGYAAASEWYLNHGGRE